MEDKLEKILKKLSTELEYKWKIQTKPTVDKKGSCVAYIDARQVQGLLDKTCAWENEFYESKGKLFCKIGIHTDKGVLWRSDSGFLENDNIEDSTESKGEVSDTFKRAAVQWGIGRFLYSKKIEWITLGEFNTNKYKLTEFIQKRNNTFNQDVNSYSYGEMTKAKTDILKEKIEGAKTVEELLGYKEEIETNCISDKQKQFFRNVANEKYKQLNKDNSEDLSKPNF